MNRQRLRGPAVLAALLAWAWAGHALWKAYAPPDAAPARRQLAAVRARWQAALAFRPAAPDDTYAALGGGPTAAAWGELLTAAGVPVPAQLPPDPTGFRLVVLRTPDDAAAEALAAPGRAVIQVAPGVVPAADATARLGSVVIPLLAQPARSLHPTADDRVLLVASGGAVLGTLRPLRGGVLVRLGVDLAELFLRARQGDPARADRDTDGNGEVQPADLLPSLPADLADEPFADLATDALLAAIDAALPCPLPRTRGLPAGVRAVVVLTADQDYAADERLLQLSTRLAARGATASFLLTDPAVGAPADLNVGSGRAPTASRATLDALLAAGHGLGIHPFPREALDVARHAERFRTLAGVTALAARNHHLRWRGHLDVPAHEAAAGVGLNLDFMAVCRGEAPCAAFPGGAARPQLFIVGERALPILEQPTALDDFSLRAHGLAGLRPAAVQLRDRAAAMLRTARAAGVPLVVNAHPVFAVLAPEWLDGLLGDPHARVLSAERWLDFVARRRVSRIPSPRCGLAPRAILADGVELR